MWSLKHLLLAMTAVLAAVARAEVKLGEPFPALTSGSLVNLRNGPIPSTEGRVTLVDFWASWCAPCKASFPALAALDREYRARGLQIVAISVDEKPAAAEAFLKRMDPPFVAVRDDGQKLVARVGVPTMPTSYLLDRAGRVRFVHEGFHGVAELRREIEALLAESLSTRSSP